MRTKFLYLAAVVAAALITSSCEKEKNPPLLSYYQINAGPKYALKWSGVNTLSPAAGESYDIALSVGNTTWTEGDPPVVIVKPLPEMTDVFTFSVPVEDMGQVLSLPNDAVVNIKLGNLPYSTEDGTIRSGSLKVTRNGTQNDFTIDFLFILRSDNSTISGKHQGKLNVSDNVYLIQ